MYCYTDKNNVLQATYFKGQTCNAPTTGNKKNII